MKTKPWLLLLPTLLAPHFMVGAESAYRTDVNPALLYWQVFSQMPELSPEESKLLERRQFAPTDQAYGELVARYDTAFRLARRGPGMKPRADWGVDLADGPYALLPHLAKAKAVAQAAQFRARYFLDHGREDDAVQDLAAALVLGRHLASDGVLISTLVQIAIEGIVQYSAAENFHGFSPRGLQKLMAAIDAAPASDTVSQCIHTGERSFGGWYRRRLQEIDAAHPGDEKSFLAEVRKVMASTIAEEESIEAAEKFIREAGGTRQGLLDLGKSVDALYDELKAVSDLPYERFEAANKVFFERIEASKNPFVTTFFPALQKARAKEFRNQARTEMLRAAIQFRLRGDEGLKSVRDPFGSGPFGFRRFVLNHVDRGFELKSKFAYTDEFPEVMIFVEKSGPPFRLLGPTAGKPFEDKP